jgi:hypothetical protein
MRFSPNFIHYQGIILFQQILFQIRPNFHHSDEASAQLCSHCRKKGSAPKANVSPQYEHSNVSSKAMDMEFRCCALLSVLSCERVGEMDIVIVVILHIIVRGVSRLTEVESTTVTA